MNLPLPPSGPGHAPVRHRLPAKPALHPWPRPARARTTPPFVAATLAALCLTGATQPRSAAAEPPLLPDFQEVHGILRSNLTPITEQELNRAAVEGLLKALEPRVELLSGTNLAPAAPAVTGAIAQSRLFDDVHAYVRIARISPGLREEFKAALEKLGATKPWRGLVLDLRFAHGLDYAAVGDFAGEFLAAATPLLAGDGEPVGTRANARPWKAPVMMIVNRQTAGAAEALAAALRAHKVGLVIGTLTAGRACRFEEFKLSTGQTLRVASAPVKLADGTALPATGLQPDIAIAVSAAEERAYLDNPYAGPPGLTGNPGATNPLAHGLGPPRRLNEAELVRRRQEGTTDARGSAPEDTAAPERPQVVDPALARALDLLKALAVVRPRTL